MYKDWNLKGKIILNQNEIDYINDCISNSITKKELAKSLNISTNSLNRLLKEYKIDYPRFSKRRNIKTNIFLDLNNPEVNYWLGWLSSDGHISEDRISLSLQYEDIDVLEKFNKFLGDSLKIYTGFHHQRFKYCRLSFRNKLICDYLRSLGYSNTKTYNLNISFNITWDYIRGFFEGDGYLQFNSNHKRIELVGKSLSHINKIYEFLILNNIKAYLKDKSRIYSIEIYEIKSIVQFLDNIYLNAQVYMNRKYNIYLNAKANEKFAHYFL